MKHTSSSTSFESMFLLLWSHPDSLRPHGLHHARPPCPSPSPKVCPSLCPLHWWCHPAISSSDAFLSFCLQSFPASRTFALIRLFASDDQNTRASASASVPSNEYSGLISLKIDCLDLLSVQGTFRSLLLTTVQRPLFFGALSSLWSNSHNCTWPLGRS